MALRDSLLPEFEMEMAHTRKVLERVPMEKAGWKIHEKSFSMGDLASHLANIPTWGAFTLKTESLDIAPPGGEPMRPVVAKTRDELVAIFDKGAAEAKASIAAADDANLMQPWTLLSGGKAILTMPRVAVLRGMILNHLIHHRAQLGIYLRMNDVAVPAVYGPSADEGGM